MGFEVDFDDVPNKHGFLYPGEGVVDDYVQGFEDGMEVADEQHQASLLEPHELVDETGESEEWEHQAQGFDAQVEEFLESVDEYESEDGDD